ncbi:hypothetical protein LTS17_004177 [Exophiala oligosperma]
MGAGSAERDIDSMPDGHKPDLQRTGRRIHKASKRAHCEEEELGTSLQDDIRKQNPPKHTKGAIRSSRQDQYIQHWLDNIHIPRKSSTSLHGTVIDMPRKAPSSIPTDIESTAEESGTKTTASVDALALHYRNIVIGKVPPPKGLEGRARQIISGVPTSGDIDHTALENLRQLLIREEGENESMLVTLLLPSLQVLGIGATLDPKLRARPNQLWFNCVPIPLLKEFEPLSSSLPSLSRPKPDVTFGFSLEAFTLTQQFTLGSVCDKNNPKQNYAIPDGKTVFPFLTFEFKAEANRGTHFSAKKQAANSGAIALNGNLRLMEQCGLGLRVFERGEPHYFSITIEFASARVNLHWVEVPAKRGGPYRFHVNTLEIYPLIHVEGLLALFRAVRNILEWAVKTRLPKLCAALDAYH